MMLKVCEIFDVVNCNRQIYAKISLPLCGSMRYRLFIVHFGKQLRALWSSEMLY